MNLLIIVIDQSVNTDINAAILLDKGVLSLTNPNLLTFSSSKSSGAFTFVPVSPPT